jgi:hypothetical protein
MHLLFWVGGSISFSKDTFKGFQNLLNMNHIPCFEKLKLFKSQCVKKIILVNIFLGLLLVSSF